MNRWEMPILNLICHVPPLMNNLLPGFKFISNPFATTFKQIVVNKNTISLVKSNITYKTKETTQCNS